MAVSSAAGPARSPTKAKDRRRKPTDVRQAALAVGRRLLTEGGPGALTLKAVAAELGMSHPNLIHHFGSADAFQIELKRTMVEDLTRTVTSLLRRQGDGPADTATIVDTVFSAYGEGGISTMLAWSALARNDGNEEAVVRAVGELVAVLTPMMPGPDAGGDAGRLVRIVTLLAFADSLIGRGLADAVGGAPDETRALTVRLATDLGWLTGKTGIDGPTGTPAKTSGGTRRDGR